MATKYLALLTSIGAAKLAKATALGTKVEITQMAVGDGNGVLPTPNPAQTALVHELRRAPLNMLTVDPANASQIIAEQVIPEEVGGWWIREIGLFDKDGDMVAIANCAETYKPQLQEGSGRVQVIRVILIVSSTKAVTLKIDPAVVLATRQYVDNQLRAHEQSRNHPDASTAEKGFVQLSSSVTSDNESQAATPKAVKIAMDNANARLAKDRNLSDLPNPALARQNLELGGSSTRNVGTTAGTVAAGDDARITGAMQKSQNGGDIPDVSKFLQNIGLGTLQSSFTDKSGKIALNGGWGLGIKADQVSGTMEALDVSRFDYFAPADNIGPYPGKWAGGISFANSGSTGWQICGASLSSVPDFSVRIKTGQTTFSNWYKLYHTGNKPSATDVGALPSDGKAASASTADTATKLAAARKIAGVSFDGTADINLGPDNVGAVSTGGGNYNQIFRFLQVETIPKESNPVQLVSAASGQAADTFVAWSSYTWYNDYVRTGIVRAGDKTLKSFAVEINGVRFLEIGRDGTLLNGNMASDLRLGQQESMNVNIPGSGLSTDSVVPSGCYVTGLTSTSTGNYIGITKIFYRRLQRKVAGNWVDATWL